MKKVGSLQCQCLVSVRGYVSQTFYTDTDIVATSVGQEEQSTLGQVVIGKQLTCGYIYIYISILDCVCNCKL